MHAENTRVRINWQASNVSQVVIILGLWRCKINARFVELVAVVLDNLWTVESGKT